MKIINKIRNLEDLLKDKSPLIINIYPLRALLIALLRQISELVNILENHLDKRSSLWKVFLISCKAYFYWLVVNLFVVGNASEIKISERNVPAEHIYNLNRFDYFLDNHSWRGISELYKKLYIFLNGEIEKDNLSKHIEKLIKNTSLYTDLLNIGFTSLTQLIRLCVSQGQYFHEAKYPLSISFEPLITEANISSFHEYKCENYKLSQKNYLKMQRNIKYGLDYDYDGIYSFYFKDKTLYSFKFRKLYAITEFYEKEGSMFIKNFKIFDSFEAIYGKYMNISYSEEVSDIVEGFIKHKIFYFDKQITRDFTLLKYLIGRLIYAIIIILIGLIFLPITLYFILARKLNK